MRKLLVAAAAALLASQAAATPPLSPPPRLLVVISVDQLSAGLWDEYSPQFSGGLARLAGGTVFRNGYQSHAASETCPGHSTILTGVHPAGNGIIANQWTDQSAVRADKTIYCSEDERVPGTTSSNYKLSAIHLKVPTLGELMKARWPASRNVAVAGKDRAAVMMSGRAADQRWYFNGKAFVSDLDTAPPRSVPAINASVAQAIATARPPLEAPPFCQAKARPIPIEGHAPVGAGTFARAAGDASGFRSSPEYDGAVLALAAALVREMRLGNGTAPDVLSIGLSATDYVGHYFGTGGQEMCLQLLSLDRDLGDFFAFLDKSGVDYSVALTADHGGEDIPERLRLKGVAQAQRVDPQLAASAMGKAIAADLELSGPVLFGDVAGDMYVDRNLPAAERARALAEAISRYRGHRQVEAVFTREELLRTPMPSSSPSNWSLKERARASADAQRSGDFFVILKQHVTPIGHATNAVATHGTPWDYDRRVPILFWRPGFSGAARDSAADTVDIMPTLAAMIGLDVAGRSIDGKCLDNVSGAICPPR